MDIVERIKLSFPIDFCGMNKMADDEYHDLCFSMCAYVDDIILRYFPMLILMGTNYLCLITSEKLRTFCLSENSLFADSD